MGRRLMLFLWACAVGVMLYGAQYKLKSRATDGPAEVDHDSAVLLRRSRRNAAAAAGSPTTHHYDAAPPPPTPPMVAEIGAVGSTSSTGTTVVGGERAGIGSGQTAASTETGVKFFSPGQSSDARRSVQQAIDSQPAPSEGLLWGATQTSWGQAERESDNVRRLLQADGMTSWRPDLTKLPPQRPADAPMDRLLEHVPAGGMAWLAFGNSGVTEMLMNWAHHVIELGYAWQMVVAVHQETASNPPALGPMRPSCSPAAVPMWSFGGRRLTRRCSRRCTNGGYPRTTTRARCPPSISVTLRTSSTGWDTSRRSASALFSRQVGTCWSPTPM